MRAFLAQLISCAITNHPLVIIEDVGVVVVDKLCQYMVVTVLVVVAV